MAFGNCGEQEGLMARYFVGDYETGDLSQWSSTQAASGRITIVTSPAKQGSKAARFQANPSDTGIAGSNTYVRCEVYAGSPKYAQASEGREEWWRVALYFDPSLANALQSGNDSLMVYQWHHNGPTGPVPLACLVDTGGSGNLGGTVQQPVAYFWKTSTGNASSPGLQKKALHPIQFGRWYTYVWHIKWSGGSSGFTEMWVDGVHKWAVTGPNLYSGDGIYYKTGVYGTPGRAAYVMYNDCHQCYSTASELGVVVNQDGSLTDDQVPSPPPPSPPPPSPPPPSPPPPPTSVASTSNLASGAVLQGSMTWTVTADPGGHAARFYFDNTLQAEVVGPGSSFEWPFNADSALTEGSHSGGWWIVDEAGAILFRSPSLSFTAIPEEPVDPDLTSAAKDAWDTKQKLQAEIQRMRDAGMDWPAIQRKLGSVKMVPVGHTTLSWQAWQIVKDVQNPNV